MYVCMYIMCKLWDEKPNSVNNYLATFPNRMYSYWNRITINKPGWMNGKDLESKRLYLLDVKSISSQLYMYKWMVHEKLGSKGNKKKSLGKK